MAWVSRISLFAARIDHEIDQGVEQLANEIAADAKDRVPVASGALRDSIHVEKTPDGVKVVAGNDKVFYGHLVEFGTVHSGARPFLIPAAEGKRPSLRTRMATRLRGS